MVGSIEVAQTAERHALAETEVLKAQGDSEQVNRAACQHVNLLLAQNKCSVAYTSCWCGEFSAHVSSSAWVLGCACLTLMVMYMHASISSQGQL